MNHQEKEGLRIAAERDFTQHDGYWTVPQGQNRFLFYRLVLRKGEHDCTCAEFQRLRPQWCRHLYALREVLRQENELEQTRIRPPAKTKYPRNWPKYHAARRNRPRDFKIFLRDLCSRLPTPAPTSKGGRPKISIPDLVYAAVTKVRVRRSGKEMSSLLNEEHGQSYIAQIPEASTIHSFLKSPEASGILVGLIGDCCVPLRDHEVQFAIDSSYFPTTQVRKWYDKKQKRAVQKRARFKAHISSGIHSNIIAAIRVTPDKGEGTGDASQFPYLLAETAKRFRVLEVLADAAYCSHFDFEIVRQLGARFTTYFTKRDKGRGGGGEYKRAFLFQWEQPKEHFERYGLRNNVETTNSMIKREFPGQLVSRSAKAIENEILCMALIHNIHCLIMAKYTMDLEIKF
jgi:hypothetical protein